MWSRVRTLFTGFISLFIGGLEKQNPRALIEAEKENLRKQIGRFNDSLATEASLSQPDRLDYGRKLSQKLYSLVPHAPQSVA